MDFTVDALFRLHLMFLAVCTAVLAAASWPVHPGLVAAVVATGVGAAILLYAQKAALVQRLVEGQGLPYDMKTRARDWELLSSVKQLTLTHEQAIRQALVMLGLLFIYIMIVAATKGQGVPA